MGGFNEQDAQLVLHTDSRLFDWPLDGLFDLGKSMTKDEALRLAWDALQQIAHVSAMDYEYQQWAVEAITAIKEALAQPEQEPVAWRYRWSVEGGNWVWNYATYIERQKDDRCEPLYTTPPQRTWVGLTDEEVKNFVQAVWPREATPTDYIRAIEAKLKEKNG